MGQRVVKRGGYRRPGSWLAAARHRWFMWRSYRIRWVSAAWSFMWTRGTFTRRFWTVVIISLAVYVTADLIVAAVTS